MKWVEFMTLDGTKHFVNVENIVEAHPAADDKSVLTFTGKEDATVDLPYDAVKKILMDVSP